MFLILSQKACRSLFLSRLSSECHAFVGAGISYLLIKAAYLVMPLQNSCFVSLNYLLQLTVSLAEFKTGLWRVLYADIQIQRAVHLWDFIISRCSRGKVHCGIQAVELELAVTLFMLSFLFQTHSKNRTNPRDSRVRMALPWIWIWRWNSWSDSVHDVNPGFFSQRLLKLGK